MQGNEEADGAVLWSDCMSWRKRGGGGREEEEVRWEKKRDCKDEVGVRSEEATRRRAESGWWIWRRKEPTEVGLACSPWRIHAP